MSVRNAIEARAALGGGCDVLDVKEPARGALGMADVSAIEGIVAHANSCDSPVPISVALGEAAEWTSGRPIPRLPPGIAYLKLGTAGQEEAAGWATAFAAVKRRIDVSSQTMRTAVAESTASVACGSAPVWIAVAYADWQMARSPAPEDVIAKASECGCTGVLIDTYSKGRLRLLDWLDGRRLCSLAAQARALGQTFALAGRLQIGDLRQVLTADPDTVGIRSAACREGLRSGEIDAAAVGAFRAALHDVSVNMVSS